MEMYAQRRWLESQTIPKATPETRSSTKLESGIWPQAKYIARTVLLATTIMCRFALCPGDDILAVGMILYQSIGDAPIRAVTDDVSSRVAALPSRNTFQETRLVWDKRKILISKRKVA